MNQPIGHHSFSSLSTLMDCPRMFYASYVMREKTAPGEAAKFGSQFDQVVATKAGLLNLSDVEGPLAEGMEEAVATYMAAPGVRSMISRAKGYQTKIELTPDQWEGYADLHGAAGAGRISVPYIGYIDLHGVDEVGLKKWVLDLKTSSRKGFQAKWALQSTLYGLHQGASTAHVHLLTRTKVPAVYRYQWPVTSAWVQWSLNTLGFYAKLATDVEKADSAESLPAKPDYYCSWCSQQLTCQAAKAELIREE